MPWDGDPPEFRLMSLCMCFTFYNRGRQKSTYQYTGKSRVIIWLIVKAINTKHTKEAGTPNHDAATE
jgi:hypothetical protein